MLNLSAARWYRLLPVGTQSVACDGRGVSVGSVPLLERRLGVPGRTGWAPRALATINDELSAAYGLPVDLTAKLGGLAAVARALNRGEVALAQIAALQLHLPDVPKPTKTGRSEDETAALAALLRWAGILEPERALVKVA